MIQAEHKKWANHIFSYYEKHILRKSFSKFNLINEPPLIPSDKSLLITPNHISWWDGFFIRFVLEDKLNRRIYIMMLESQLKKYWFFKKLGAFSINPQNPKSIIQTFNYTEQILQNTKNFVVTYPQGKIRPFEERPLDIKEGIKNIIKRIYRNTVVLPVGFKIQYFEERNPEVFCRFGDIITGESIINDFQFFVDQFTKNLDEISIAASNREYRVRLI